MILGKTKNNNKKKTCDSKNHIVLVWIVSKISHLLFITVIWTFLYSGRQSKSVWWDSLKLHLILITWIQIFSIKSCSFVNITISYIHNVWNSMANRDVQNLHQFIFSIIGLRSRDLSKFNFLYTLDTWLITCLRIFQFPTCH